MAKFEKGHSLAQGRPRGSLNARTFEFIRALHDNDFDAAAEMIKIYKEAKKTYDNYATIYDALEETRIQEGVNPYPTEDKADKYLKIALDAVKEIASYCYPKLKSVEQVKESPLDGMTNEQKLEALKQAVKLLEQQNEPRPVDSGSDQAK